MRPATPLHLLAFCGGIALLLGGCPTSAPPPPPGPFPPAGPLPPVAPVPAGPAAPPAPGGGITISPGGGPGGFQIQGAPPLHGDPAACAAFQACCAPHQGQLSPPGLACGLAPASSNGDCAAALQSIRAIFTEQGLALPMGCGP